MSEPLAIRRPDPPHVLVVEDDPGIRGLVGSFLGDQGYRVTAVADGRAMDAALMRGGVDIIVLDVMLPGESGIAICRRLRRAGGPPILLLTARGEHADRIDGLQSGADDYLVKPFHPGELAARINAVLRRWSVPPESDQRVAAAEIAAYRFERWTVDLSRRQLLDGEGVRVTLTSGEFDLLVAFCRSAGRVLTRDTLLETTRRRVAGPFDRSVDIMVSRLRRKLGNDAAGEDLITTVRNAGYLFTAAVTGVPAGAPTDAA